MAKTIGVLGGMGPEATAHFYRRIIELTPARNDQEHIPVIIFSQPRIPDRTASIKGLGESPAPALQKVAQLLQEAGAEFLTIPCNTAHYYWNEITDVVEIPVLNIIEETAEKIRQEAIDGVDTKKSVLILATEGTIATGLYQGALNERGIIPLVPQDHHQNQVQSIIEATKAGHNKIQLATQLKEMMGAYIKRGVFGAILGCTELGLLINPASSQIRLYDSLEILASSAVKKALEG